MEDYIIFFLILLFLEIPGAFVRWIWLRKKYSFKEVLLNNNRIYNFIISVILLAIGLSIFNSFN
ncbi:hypothetical protein KORDIASMS9_01414 [Kordia sp. SMS9]|nr:hypothetical protein KORDIASMS9_01414 [Kordia sp. SMS9]